MRRSAESSLPTTFRHFTVPRHKRPVAKGESISHPVADELIEFLDQYFLQHHELNGDCYLKLQQLIASHGNKIKLIDQLLKTMNPDSPRFSVPHFVRPKSSAFKKRNSLEAIFYYQLHHLRDYHDGLNNYYNRILDSYFHRNVAQLFNTPRNGEPLNMTQEIEPIQIIKNIADFNNRHLGLNYAMLLALHDLPRVKYDAVMADWYQLATIFEFHFEQHRNQPAVVDQQRNFQSCLIRQWQTLHVLVKGLINTYPQRNGQVHEVHQNGHRRHR